MKLPIQKSTNKSESMAPDEMWPGARSLVERLMPDEWMRPWYGFDRNMLKEMQAWTPKVDIAENDTEFSIKADVPGVKPEDIKVEVSGDSLMISGSSEEETEEKGKTWHRIERRSGSFQREFELPKGADPDRIEAHSKNGILMVKVPKRPDAQSKTIEVKAEGGAGERRSNENRPGENRPGPGMSGAEMM